MEFASLEDAYGELSIKKKKKVKSRPDDTDPDRPAVQRMERVEAFGQPAEVAMDEYLDESAKFQKRSSVNSSLPAPRTLSGGAVSGVQTPSFFGAEPFTNPAEDTKAPYTSHTSPNAYMLESETGFGKSSGASLPIPELRHRWKPLSVDRVESAFFTDGDRTSERQSGQFSGMDTGDMAAMRSKLDTLMARLDDLEYRAAGANPQMEMLSFIMTGLFLMFVLDLTVRKSGR